MTEIKKKESVSLKWMFQDTWAKQNLIPKHGKTV